MKKSILIIGSILTLGLAILWYFNIISEPLVAIGSGILTLATYIFATDDKQFTKKINQKHSGKGDNVAGNKIIKK